MKGSRTIHVYRCDGISVRPSDSLVFSDLVVLLAIYLSICLLSICLSIWLSVCLSGYLSVCLSIYLSVVAFCSLDAWIVYLKRNKSQKSWFARQFQKGDVKQTATQGWRGLERFMCIVVMVYLCGPVIHWYSQTWWCCWLSIYLSVFCLSVCLSGYLSVYLAICLSIWLSVCLSIYLSS